MERSMWHLTAFPAPQGIFWEFAPDAIPEHEDAEVLRIGFHFTSFRNGMQRREALKALEFLVKASRLQWLLPGRTKWTIDLSALREFKVTPNPQPKHSLADLKWRAGQVFIEPEIESDVQHRREGPPSYYTNIVFYLDPAHLGELRSEGHMTEPVEIQQSLAKFREEYADPSSVAFLMMKFGQTPAHTQFVKAIRAAFGEHGITVLRADDKQYHDDLFPNILTYMHGCGIGIAVFERIEADDFNPNVSLEVGYMLSMRKPVCLLKDRTQKTLPTDLVGKLYKPFDTLAPDTSITPQIDQWVSDKGLSRRPAVPPGKVEMVEPLLPMNSDKTKE